MDRRKAEQGRGREKRKIRREKSRRERVRRKKMEMREKVGKSRFTVFLQWFVAPEGRKVGSLKRRVRSQLARGEMKNCTPLWREAHFQVKMYKTHHVRTTFGSWDVLRSSRRGQGMQHVMKMLRHMWVGWGWGGGGALITFLLMLRNLQLYAATAGDKVRNMWWRCYATCGLGGGGVAHW